MKKKITGEILEVCSDKRKSREEREKKDERKEKEEKKKVSSRSFVISHKGINDHKGKVKKSNLTKVSLSTLCILN